MVVLGELLMWTLVRCRVWASLWVVNSIGCPRGIVSALSCRFWPNLTGACGLPGTGCLNSLVGLQGYCGLNSGPWYKISLNLDLLPLLNKEVLVSM